MPAPAQLRGAWYCSLGKDGHGDGDRNALALKKPPLYSQ